VSSSSNYLHLADVDDDGVPEIDGPDPFDDEEWTLCKRCYGSGEDRDGADCIHCEGMGEVLLR
jgi:hypothetical protein